MKNLILYIICQFKQISEFRFNTKRVIIRGLPKDLLIPSQDMESNSNLEQNLGY